MAENLNDALNAFNASFQGLASTVGAANLDKTNRKFAQDEAEKQREWNEKMAAQTNAWNYEMWQKINEYNSPESQLMRLRDAGLNPLYYGLDGSSANGIEAAQPLGYQRADYQSTINPAQVGLDAFAQMRSLQKDIQLKNAQIDKLNEDTSSVKLDNDFKDKTMDARVEAERLANQMTKEQMKEVQSRISVNLQEVKKKIAETKNEEERTGLIIADKALKEASAKEIMQLLPYKQLLLSAQTEAQKASAAASWLNAAINAGLLEAGYVDKQIEDITASIRQKNAAADSQEVIAAVNAWKNSVHNGTLFDVSSLNSVASRASAGVLNTLFQVISTASEAVGGGLSGFFK